MNGENSDDSAEAAAGPKADRRSDSRRDSIKALLVAEPENKIKISGFPVWNVTKRIENLPFPLVVLEDEEGYRNAVLTLTGDAEDRPLEIWNIEFDEGTVDNLKKYFPASNEAMLVDPKNWNECGCGDKIKTIPHYQKAYYGSENHNLTGTPDN